MADLSSRGVGGGNLRAWRWLVFPLSALAAVAVAVALIRLGTFWLPYLVGGALASTLLAWILASVLSPGRVDRACPRCGKQGLVRLERKSPLGVRCQECGYLDETGHVANLDGG
jgi:hypothetical protein